VLTPAWQQATILYRLEGVTMNWSKWRTKRAGPLVVQGLPIECLPIPYTITDFGRAYLRSLGPRASWAERAFDAHPSTETPEPPPPAGPTC